jgi:beta-phosphoglucomutase-like phosphatase (HAD superfamily)
VIRALVFDFDGLILETETPHGGTVASRGRFELVARLGARPPRAIASERASLAETPLESVLALLVRD